MQKEAVRVRSWCMIRERGAWSQPTGGAGSVQQGALQGSPSRAEKGW